MNKKMKKCPDVKKLEKQFPEWKVECCALIYPDPEEIEFCLECGKSLKKESRL